MGEDLSKQIASLIEAMKRAAPDVWDATVRYVLIDAWTEIILSIIVVFASIYGCRRIWKMDIDELDRPVARFIALAATCIISLICLCIIRDGLVEVLNPTYFAAMHLLSSVKK